VAIERDGTPIDEDLLVPFDDHTMVMARHRARTRVTHAGNGAPHNGRLFATGLDLAAVRG
jgi:hypothetical protein